MADDGDTKETTFTQADLDEARKDGEGAGQKTAWSHWQGVTDKQVADIRQSEGAKNTELANELGKLKLQNLEGLSTEEQSLAYLKEMNERLKSPGDFSSDKPVKSTDFSDTDSKPDDDTAKLQKEQRNEVSGVIKDMGYDPGKIEWGDGKDPKADMKAFIVSIVSQDKSGKESTSEDDEETNRGTGTSSRGGESFNIMTADPTALMAEGLKEGNIMPRGGGSQR